MAGRSSLKLSESTRSAAAGPPQGRDSIARSVNCTNALDVNGLSGMVPDDYLQIRERLCFITAEPVLQVGFARKA